MLPSHRHRVVVAVVIMVLKREKDQLWDGRERIRVLGGGRSQASPRTYALRRW